MIQRLSLHGILGVKPYILRTRTGYDFIRFINYYYDHRFVCYIAEWVCTS